MPAGLLKKSKTQRKALKSLNFIAATALFTLSGAVAANAVSSAPIPNNHPIGAEQLMNQSAAPASKSLQLEIYLKPNNQAELDQLAEDQQDPSSPEYHNWLTPDQYAERFGPSDSDVSEIVRWLSSQGFTVTSANTRQGRITFRGDVGSAEKAFQVKIARTSNGTTFSNLTDPQVPSSLAPKIAYLAGLDNLNDTVWNTAITTNGSTTNHFGPTDIRTFNNEGALLGAGFDGTGQCIALSEGSDVLNNPSNPAEPALVQFNTQFGLPAFTTGNFSQVFVDGTPSSPGANGGAPYGEAMLDVEYSHGIAPGAKIVVYAGDLADSSNQPQTLVDTISTIVNDTTNNCKSVAVSWAQCGEPQAFYTQLSSLFQQGASEGESIFVATGDVGTAAKNPIGSGSGCSNPTKSSRFIEENAGSPFVTAVGASMFQPNYDSSGNDTSTDGGTKQQVWSFQLKSPISFLNGAAASTGGYSKIFAKPSYQNGVKGISSKFRAVPDLVLGGGTEGGSETITEKNNKLKITGKIFPAPGFWESDDTNFLSGNIPPGVPVWEAGGGTSIVPPQYAGILAIINQKAGTPGGQGLINVKLYEMAQANLKKLKNVGIYDITSGNNGVPPSVPGYAAKAGFDPASGWGAIDFTQFVNAFIGFVPPPPKKK